MKIFSMDNRKVIYKLGIVLGLAFSAGACKPTYDEIDNNNVISKPYVLYVGDTFGAIYKTNDGLNFQSVFGPDNYPATAMVVSGQNLIYIKNNVHIIENLGQAGSNTNPTLIGGAFENYGESIIIAPNIPAFKNRVYIGSVGDHGLMYNDSNGRPGISYANWKSDNDSAFILSPGNVITSLTLLDDGTLIAYDDGNKRTFKLTGITQKWSQTTGGKLPASGNFFLSHKGNVLLAADRTGANGVYYSTNYGNSWSPYTGIPTTSKILSMCGGFGQTVLVGTDGGGVYRLPVGSTKFVTANIGMPKNAFVKSLSEKYDYFKNNTSKQYIYAATDQGVYRSQDLGENWVKVYENPNKKGSFTVMY